MFSLNFPGATVAKNPPANPGDTGLIPGQEDSTRRCTAAKLMHHNHQGGARESTLCNEKSPRKEKPTRRK